MKVIEMLHPGIKIAGRKLLPGRLLDEEHERVQVFSNVLVHSRTLLSWQAQAKGESEGQRATSSIDGWSNICGLN